MDTETPDLHTVVRQLANVEGQCRALAKQNRRLKIAGSVALLLIGAVVLVGATMPKPKVIEAEQFLVRGQDGKARAGLGMFPSRSGDSAPEPGLRIYDNSSISRIDLGLSGATPSLCLRDGQANTSAELALDADGNLSLTFTASGGGDGLVPELVSLELGKDNAWLMLHDNQGNPRVAVRRDEDGSGHLCIYDRRGRVIWQAPPAE